MNLERVVGFYLEKADETTNGHEWTRIRTTRAASLFHPEGEHAAAPEFVFIGVHSWFKKEFVQATAGFRFNLKRAS